MSQRLVSTDRVVDLNAYRRRLALAIQPACRHCGAQLFDGENEEECSARLDEDITWAHRRVFRAE